MSAGEDDYDNMEDDVDLRFLIDNPDQNRYNYKSYFIETDSDDDFDLSWKHDTTAQQARQGKDIQGIQWNALHIVREFYRETRVQQYKNYQNLDVSHDELEKECQNFTKDGKFYNFQFNAGSVKSTFVHFQLRNLVWATSKHDIYVLSSYSVIHWCPLNKKRTEVLNVSGPVIPNGEAESKLLGFHRGLSRIQISTMCVKDNLLVAGGFEGELVVKNLDQHEVAFCAKITHDENGITNAIEIYDNASGSSQFMTSNNDRVVRIFDTETFSVVGCHLYPWAVNHTSVSPDKKTVLVVGDDTDGFLVDHQTGKVISVLKGHLDYSFATAWHPNGYYFATGNQDTTCRIWDARNTSSAVTVLKGRMGAIRSLRFTTDGNFLAMAEPADFVHVFDTKNNYNLSQEIDLFGEISGISFSPDTESLFIGVADRTYSSLLEYKRHHACGYMDSMF